MREMHVNIRVFGGIVLILLVVAGKDAVMDGEIVRVKEGDSVAELVNISGLKPVHIRILQKCDRWKTVLLYCSPGEEKKGCFNITSARISAQIVNYNVSIVLHNVTTGDAGLYLVHFTGGDEGKEAKQMRFQVTVEPLEINSKTEPPFIPTDITFDYIPLALILLIAVGLVLFGFGFIRYTQERLQVRSQEQHRHASVQSSDCEEDLCDESITIDNKTHRNQSLLLIHETNLQPSPNLTRQS